MDIDEILGNMSTMVEKDKKYLKGLYNKGKEELSEQFGDAISEERTMVLALTKVGKQYNMSKTEIDALVSGEEPEEEDFDLEFDDDEETIVGMTDDGEEILESIKIYDDIDDVPKPSGNSWAEIMANVPDPFPDSKDVDYEKTPSLIVELGPTYYLKVDLTSDPYPHEFDGKYGTYTKTAIKVFLQKVSDTDLYKVRYTKGDFAGKLAFVDGKKYTLWMDEKCLGMFKMFCMKHRGVPVPDASEFTFRYTKKANYNVWQFGKPK